MLYRALLLASLIASCQAMEDCTTTFCDYAQARYKLLINEDLLNTITAPDAKTLIAQVQIYYAQQPAHQTSYKAYLLKPVGNIKKIAAYLQLARAVSLEVRESASQQQRIDGPIDSLILPRVRREWPLISVRYDLQEMQGNMQEYHQWAIQKFSLIPTTPVLEAFCARLKNDHEKTVRAIDICNKYKKYLNNYHVSFENSSE